MNIRNKSDYQAFLKADLEALGIESTLKNRLTHDIWQFQKMLRKVEYLMNCKDSKLFKVYTLFMRLKLRKKGRKLGFSIPPNVCGSGLSLAHAGTIVINSNASIGKNCRIHVCVNIGADISDGTKAPILGDNCYIGPGAKLFGGIKLGDNVGVGANAVVNKSIESNVTVAGAPARIIKNAGPLDYRNQQ